MAMRNFKGLLGLIVLVGSSLLGHAQQKLEISLKDTVALSIPSFRGTIQWQQSVDGANWEDIASATTNNYQKVVDATPLTFRAKITEGTCAPVYSGTLEVTLKTANNFKLWSDPATWGGNKPVAGQNVIIPEGDEILMDETPPALGGLTIDGLLSFDAKDLQLTAKWIMVHGEFRIGSEGNRYTNKAVLTLTGEDTNENVMGMGTRGIMVDGGSLELHGAPPSVVWTKLNEHAQKSATIIKILENTDWKAGDEIVIAPTDFYLAGGGTSVSQRTAIVSFSGNQLTISEPLNAFRWGLLQYATTTGISLSPVNLVTPPVPDAGEKKTPLILDERAEVGNLTRNIVIQAPNDVLWTNQGFGVHVMIMGPSSKAHVEGVEIKRGGQRGKLARYPFHWHQLSYSGSQTLADATGQYFKNSTINSSANRGVVVHGTNGVLIQKNIIYDVRGHGIFTEDAVERRNTFDGNLVLRVRNSTQPLKVHEGANGAERGASGFWISNPDNTIINNVAADCGTNGYWLAFTTQPWGLNSSVLDTRDGLLLNPSRLLFGKFDNNVAHSNNMEGIMIDRVESSNEGDTKLFQYQSTINGRQDGWPWNNLRRFTLSNYSVWKNMSNGIWDRAAWPDNYGVVSADNCGRFFAGSGGDGLIERSLVVGTSLNHLMNGTDRPASADFAAGQSSSNPAAFATYHSAFDIANNIIINFPAAEGKRSGAFATDDYYLRPVDKGHMRNIGNLLINSHPGVKLYPPYNWFCLAGVLWDPLGNWSGQPNPINYFAYDSPFFTYGQTPRAPIQGPFAGGVLVDGPFYGFNDFVVNKANEYYADFMAITVDRVNDNFETVGSWSINQAQQGWLFDHMRHFAAHASGKYVVNFPSIDVVTDVLMSVENMLTANDKTVVAVEFSGTKTISQVFASSASPGTIFSAGHTNWVPTDPNDFKQVYTAVASRAAVLSSQTGGVYWQDQANNLVWVKLKGGIKQIAWNDADYKETDDERLYRLFWLRVF